MLVPRLTLGRSSVSRGLRTGLIYRPRRGKSGSAGQALRRLENTVKVQTRTDKWSVEDKSHSMQKVFSWVALRLMQEAMSVGHFSGQLRKLRVETR